MTTFRKFLHERNVNTWALILVAVYAIFVIKFITLKEIDNNIFFGLYSLAVSFYLLSRFALAYLYVPGRDKFDTHYEPTISFAVPSKNEEVNIRETIIRIASTDYPQEKFNIIAINDGSTDNTLAEMQAAQKIAKKVFGVEVIIVDWNVNRGKREGMAECVKQSKNDIVLFY
jgi:hyaluronan synthase